MRWTVKVKEYPTSGQIRHLKKFLWFPLTIGDECRWLEVAVITQRFHESQMSAGSYYWENIAFESRQRYATGGTNG